MSFLHNLSCSVFVSMLLCLKTLVCYFVFLHSLSCSVFVSMLLCLKRLVCYYVFLIRYYVFKNMSLTGLEFLPDDDVQEGEPQNLGVHPPRAVRQVVEVEFQSAQHLLHGIGISVVECRVGGYARAYLV